MKDLLRNTLTDRWWRRILNPRKQFFYEYLTEKNTNRKISVRKLLFLLKDDVAYISSSIINILLQIRANGKVIKSHYGISYRSQFSKMAYLAFNKRVKPGYFLRLQLFKQETWKYVDDYAYFHTPSQRVFAETTCPGETELFLDKLQFYQFCRTREIPTPTIFAVYENGQQIYPEKPFVLPEEDLFVKNRDGQMGWGAKKFSYSNNRYHDKEGRIYEKQDVIRFLSNYSREKSPVIMQNVIVNHKDWQSLTPGALATSRIVTAKSPANKSVFPIFAVLRMPLKDSDTDNFSGGGLIAKIEFDTGVMGRIFSAHPVQNQFEFSAHPHTGRKVEGEKLPNWNELLEFTLDLHRKVRSPFVGWDVCMTDRGCCVTEGSVLWASGSCECAYGKPMKETIYPVLFEQWMEIYHK